MSAPTSQIPLAPEVPSSRELPLTVIRPARGWTHPQLGDLWNYRELIGFLTWRDISVRYKQTVFGVAWAVIQPFFTMVVFSIFFGHLAKIGSDGVPYPIFSYAGLLPWQFFSYSLTQSGNSLVANQSLVSKVYFPRLAIPIAVVLAGLVDLVIASSVLAGMMVWYGIAPPVQIVLLPLFVLLAIATSIGVGLWLSALAVEYRDIQYVIPFLLQFWLFVTPIAYPASIVPAGYRFLLGLNPMAGVVEGFRWTILGTDSAPGPLILVSIAVTLLLLVTGLFHFRRMEATFADRI
jgi:lipopolysaccharide transport system permease protein